MYDKDFQLILSVLLHYHRKFKNTKLLPNFHFYHNNKYVLHKTWQNVKTYQYLDDVCHQK